MKWGSEKFASADMVSLVDRIYENSPLFNMTGKDCGLSLRCVAVDPCELLWPNEPCPL